MKTKEEIITLGKPCACCGRDRFPNMEKSLNSLLLRSINNQITEKLTMFNVNKELFGFTISSKKINGVRIKKTFICLDCIETIIAWERLKKGKRSFEVFE